MTVVTAKVAGVERVTACTPPIRGEIPARHHRGHASRRRRRDLPAGRRAGGRGDGGRHRDHRQGRPARRPGQRLRRGGQAPAVRRGGHRPVRRARPRSSSSPTTHADPFVVAVDLLSQAEHGPDSPAVLITTSEDVARAAMAHIDRLLPDMPTNDMAGPAWRDHGQVHVVDDLDEAYAAGRQLRQRARADPHRAARARRWRRCATTARSSSARAPACPTATRCIGTNHVLPTRGAARYTGGLWVGKYLRTVTYQEVTDRAASARPRRALRPRVPRRAVRGTCPVRRRPRREVRRRPAALGDRDVYAPAR